MPPFTMIIVDPLLKLPHDDNYYDLCTTKQAVVTGKQANKIRSLVSLYKDDDQSDHQ